MIDIDHFKAYNDHYGHPAGDVCLREVAQALQGALRRSGDMLTRYGGEEFALLLPDTGLAGTQMVAERLRRAVLDLSLPHQAHPLGQVTISLGAASLHGVTGSELVQAADGALYAAKRAGRNRVALHDEAGTPQVLVAQ
ncbi:diguanylate cyclase [Deinococcus radiophilus]|uniref:GGDEF domain-containing protein n=1 Tax=Deinococcus radiophilus TaxID=32062 RepID=A0A3S0L8K1_9DEIO|nr:diguanylate cyclase [Deinococcus radiophilus]RTR29478.1 GGDEF domain-containing protein [Deinococcus radiophilus]